MESKLFPYIHDTWVASKHWSVPSACNDPPGFHSVSLMRALAQWGCQSHEGVNLRVPFEASRHLLSYDEYYGSWRTRKMPLAFIVAVIPCCRYKMSAYSWLRHLLIFLPHQLPLLHNLVDFKLTNLWSLVKLLFWAQRSGKIIWLIPRSEMHLMPKTHVVLPLTPFLTKASLHLPRVFPSYIYSAPFSFSFISSWLIFERETERDRRFLLRRLNFLHFIYRQSSGLSSESHF